MDAKEFTEATVDATEVTVDVRESAKFEGMDAVASTESAMNHGRSTIDSASPISDETVVSGGSNSYHMGVGTKLKRIVRRFPRPLISIRACVLPLIVIILLTSVLCLSVYNHFAADETAQHLSTEVLLQTAQRLDDFVHSLFAHGNLEAAKHNSYVRRFLDSNEQEHLWGHMADTIRYNGCPTMTYSFPSGDSVLVTPVDKNWRSMDPESIRIHASVLKYNSTTQAIDLYLHEVSQNFSQPSQLLFVSYGYNFDIRNYTHYTLPLQLRRQCWTPFMTFHAGVGGFAVSVPSFNSDGSTRLVSSIGYHSSSVITYLSGLYVADDGFAVMIVNSVEALGGLRVAYQQRKGMADLNDACTLGFCALSEIRDPVMRDFFRGLPALDSLEDFPDISRFENGDFSSGGTYFRARYRNIYGHGNTTELRAIIALIVPDSRITGTIYRTLIFNAAVSAVSVFLILVIGVAVIFEVTRQIKAIQRELEHLASFDLDSPSPKAIRSILSEMDQVGLALMRMKRAIAVIGGVTDAVLVVTPEEIIIEANRQAVALFGISPLQGVKMPMLISESDRPLFKQCFLKQSSATCEFSALHAGSVMTPVEISFGRNMRQDGIIHVLVVRDVSERHRLLEAVRESEVRATVSHAELQNLIRNANVPIFGVDRNGLITVWNEKCFKYTGFGSDDVAGTPLIKYVDEETSGTTEQMIGDALRGLVEHTNHELTLASRNMNAKVRLLVNFTTQRSVANEITGALCVGQDISEKRRLFEMEAASAAKNRLLAFVCHEIRTPLNGMLGMTDCLLESTSSLSAEQREYLSAIKICGDQLVSISNDLLDLAKIESGKFDLERIPFDVRELAEAVGALSAHKALSKDVDFSICVAPDLNARLLGDPVRLRQILLNLCSNGIKFTSEGHVLLRVQQAESTGTHATSDLLRVRFDVIDTGIGMTAEEQGRLFKEFTQVNSTITRRFGGTGIGLSIARSLVELMGGQIVVTSSPRVGSTFSITLSLAVQHQTGQGNGDGDGDVAPEWHQYAEELSVCFRREKGKGFAAYVVARTATGLTLQLYLAHVGLHATLLSSTTDALLLFTTNHSHSHSPSPSSAAPTVSFVFVDTSLPGADKLILSLIQPHPHGGNSKGPGMEMVMHVVRLETAAVGLHLGAGAGAGARLPLSLSSTSTSTSGPPSPKTSRPALLPTSPSSLIGALPFLSKPIRLVRLLSLVSVLLSAPAPALSPPPPPPPSSDATGPSTSTNLPPLHLPSLLPSSPLFSSPNEKIDGSSCPLWQLMTVPAPAPVPAPAEISVSTPTLSPLPYKILLAEDVVMNQKVFVAMMKKAGVAKEQIDVASDGQEAIEMFGRSIQGPSSRPYDLIFMDVQMPRKSGIEATASIRQTEEQLNRNHRIPIVALTANAMSQDITACLASGMNRCLTKPINRSELVAALTDYCSAPFPSPITDPESSDTSTYIASPQSLLEAHLPDS